MMKMLFKSSFIIFLMYAFSGCATKVPVTWEARVVQSVQRNLSLAYSEYGNPQAKTLLFLHGFGENRHTWRFLVPELSKKYHLIVLDLKGFGDSPKAEDDYYSVYDQAQEVYHFMQTHHLEDVTLVGRSFGGGVALVLALMQNDHLIPKVVEKLILINSMAYRQRLPSMMDQLNQPVFGFLGIHLFRNHWIAKQAYRFSFHDKHLISKDSIDYAAKYLSFPLAKYAYIKTVNQLIPDDIAKMERRYRTIELPTLILWGKEDVSIPLRTAY